MPQRVAIDILPVYYITVIAIIRTINEYPELLDTNYIYLTLANYYLAGQLPYNWFNVFKLLNIFYRHYTLYHRANFYYYLTTTPTGTR